MMHGKINICKWREMLSISGTPLEGCAGVGVLRFAQDDCLEAGAKAAATATAKVNGPHLPTAGRYGEPGVGGRSDLGAVAEK
jgi:hypothetical protein